MKTYSVYVIFLGGLMRYVGITRRPTKTRIAGHLKEKAWLAKSNEIGQMQYANFMTGLSESEAVKLERKIINKYGARLINKRRGGELGAARIKTPSGATHRVTIHLPCGDKLQVFCAPRSTGHALSPTKTAAWVRSTLLSHGVRAKASPHGFTISPTLAGAKVATTMRLYRPAP